jgi:hypothetical protein
MIQIENSKSLQNFTKQHPHLKDKLVVARFKMDGCVHCVNSQPKWDNLMDTINRSYDTHPYLLMIEIDSNVADDFIQQNDIRTEDNQPYSVSGYPEHAFIDNGVCYPSNSDVDTTMKSILQQLVKNKDIKKVKSKKSGRRTKRNRKNARAFY